MAKDPNVIRLYIDLSWKPSQIIFLSDSHSHYLQNVMRLKEGDRLLIFNGTQGEWLATIVNAKKKIIQLQILTQTRSQKSEGDLWLLFSPLKPKFQGFLEEKATELGVACLWPVSCERTSVTTINAQKMTAHLIEASEQSKRLTVPTPRPLISFPELLNTWPSERFLLFGDETLASPSLSTFSFESSQPYAFFVGPEGGFSPRELSLLRQHPNCYGVTLNPHILRAETAALVGISYIQASLLK